MAIQNSGLRFDSREIAVIFSLFIFVSLLMFTVGILVGKGLAQAKFEGIPVASSPSPERQVTSADSASSHPHSPLSTSVSTNSPIASHKPEVPESHVKADTNSHSVSEPSHHGSVPPAHQSPEEHQPVHSEGLKALNEADEMAPSESEPLELKPKKSISPDIHKDITAKFDDPESEEVLNNPKLKELFEPDGAPVKIAKPNSNRAPASKTEKLVSSYPSGPFSVQVASYADETQALERVQALKKMGFPHAYISTKALGENKETWYRVWLGYYPSFESAKASGDSLQARGEVKNYLVRKSEATSP